MIVEKWLTGWDRSNDTIIIMKYPFQETPEMFVMVSEDTPEYRRALMVTRSKTHFYKSDSQQLFGTAVEALQWLANQERRKVKNCNVIIKTAETREHTIMRVLEGIKTNGELT